jgi:DUF438 domain-containing protein
MTTRMNTLDDMTQQAALLDQLPVGITVIDMAGRIRYYNEYCARLVDRKPEYLGEDIRSCHKKAESVAAIDRILDDIQAGRRKEVYYETERKGKTLAITISPYEVDGKRVGTIQSIVIKRSSAG